MKTHDEILIERAHLISGKRPENNRIQEDELSVVEFLLSPEHYAIEECFISEVLLLKGLTTIPGSPLFIAGITNIKGKIISVVNLKVFLGLPTQGITDLNRVIVLKNKHIEFGVLTDSILGTQKVKTGLLAPGPITLQGALAGYVKGITTNGLIVLDGQHILSAKSIIVNQKQK